MACEMLRRAQRCAILFLTVAIIYANGSSAQITSSATAKAGTPKAPAPVKLNARNDEERRTRKDLAALLKTLNKKPNDAILLNNIGVAYHKLGQQDKALEFVKRSLARDGKAAKTHLNLAIVYAVLSRKDDALAAVTRSIDLDRKRKEARVFQCDLFMQLERFDDTVECFETVLDEFGDEPWIRVAIGIALTSDGDPERASRVLKDAAEDLPDDPIAQNAYAIVLYQRNKFDDAIDHLERAVETMPEVVQLRFNLAMAYWADGRKEEAREEYDVVKELDPDLAYKLNRQFYSDFLLDASVLAKDK